MEKVKVSKQKEKKTSNNKKHKEQAGKVKQIIDKATTKELKKMTSRVWGDFENPYECYEDYQSRTFTPKEIAPAAKKEVIILAKLPEELYSVKFDYDTQVGPYLYFSDKAQDYAVFMEPLPVSPVEYPACEISTEDL